MKLQEISEIKTKEKKHLLNEICLMYRKLVSVRKNIDPTRFGVSDSKILTKLASVKSISMFETILQLLTNDERLIIKNDFMNRDGNTGWYKKYYSKNTYYKTKNRAMNNFLYLFYR